MISIIMIIVSAVLWLRMTYQVVKVEKELKNNERTDKE